MAPIFPPPPRRHIRHPTAHPSKRRAWRRPSCPRPARPRRPLASWSRRRRRWTASHAGPCAGPGRGGPTARPSSATRAPRWNSRHYPCSKVSFFRFFSSVCSHFSPDEGGVGGGSHPPAEAGEMLRKRSIDGLSINRCPLIHAVLPALVLLPSCQR